MKASKVVISTLLAASVLSLSACGSKVTEGGTSTPAASPAAAKKAEATVTPSSKAFTFTDTKGEQKLAQPPRKIATAVTYLTDHMIALGLTPTATVKSQNEDFPLYLKPYLPNVEIIGEQGRISIEKLLSVGPELIVTDTNSKEVYDQFAKIAPTAYLENGYNAPTWQDAFRATAKAFGLNDKAEQTITAYQDKKKKTIEELAGTVKGKSLMVFRIRKDLRYYGDIDYKWLYDDFGFSRPAVFPKTSTESHYEVLSIEKLPDINPDYILLINDDKDTTNSLQDTNIWKGLNAVKEGHVYQIPSDTWFGGYGPNAANAMLDDLTRLFGKK
ncbi:iron-siderophore ABC transporter substrate-binding protein [Paenibacillus alba]|uniref:ABC transporter substrate-binding protein n=1 Tax=Paenibacillus alba TaxID=1197127 RepID=UPI001566D8E8|nr:iron-siderophore ABC transporter substrate-binding protein [Paenibacillus alba]NQX68742.1 iron-siderophore ABC transporter substrate-binding protein [Paenibacillus alba]